MLCALPPFLSKHFLSVTPVVATVPASWRPAPNPQEVRGVIYAPASGAVRKAMRHLCKWLLVAALL